MLYAAQKDDLAMLSELTKSDKNVSVNMNAYGGSSDQLTAVTMPMLLTASR